MAKTTKKKLKTRQVKTVSLYIDGENVSSKKADKIVEVAKRQGNLCLSKVYGLQKDEHTKKWSDKAPKCGVKDIRLSGGPKKDKVDRKIQKDVKRETGENIDTVCIATSDGGFLNTVKQLKEQGKQVVIMGEEKTPSDLQNACDKFIKI